MPDRWGRPTANDWMQIGNSFVQGQEDLQSLQDRRSDVEKRQRIENYITQIGRKQEIDTTADGYNYADHLAASAIVMQAQLSDENVKLARMANTEKKADLAQKKFDEQFEKARMGYFQLQQTKDPAKRQELEKQVWNDVLPLYDFFPDGNKAKGFSDDGTKVLFEDQRGKPFEEPRPQLDQAMQMAARFSKKFRENYLTTKEKIDILNLEQFKAAAVDPNRRVMTADGKQAIHEIFYEQDQNGDILLRQRYTDPVSGKLLKGFDYESGKEVKSNLDFRSMEYWRTMAQLSKDDVKKWEKSVDAAEKAWATNVKEGVVEPGIDEAKWKKDYAIAHFQRLAPNSKLPAGVLPENDKDNWRNWLPANVATGLVPAGGQDLKPAHRPGVAAPPAPAPAGQGQPAPAAAPGPGKPPAAQPPSQGAAPSPAGLGGQSGLGAWSRGAQSGGTGKPVAPQKPAAPKPPARQKTGLRAGLPQDPSTWKVSVINRGGQNVPVIQLAHGVEALTPEEYLYWQQHRSAPKAAH